MNVLRTMAEHPVFADCSPRELDQLMRMGTPLDVEPGYVLTREGRRGYEFFLVIEGTASCTLAGDLLATLGPGDFFGEMSLLQQSPRSATVTATTPMQLFAFDSREFNAILALAPTSNRKIMAALAARLRATQDHRGS